MSSAKIPVLSNGVSTPGRSAWSLTFSFSLIFTHFHFHFHFHFQFHFHFHFHFFTVVVGILWYHEFGLFSGWSDHRTRSPSPRTPLRARSGSHSWEEEDECDPPDRQTLFLMHRAACRPSSAEGEGDRGWEGYRTMEHSHPRRSTRWSLRTRTRVATTKKYAWDNAAAAMMAAVMAVTEEGAG
jgi:hypothetical protein